MSVWDDAQKEYTSSGSVWDQAVQEAVIPEDRWGYVVQTGNLVRAMPAPMQPYVQNYLDRQPDPKQAEAALSGTLYLSSVLQIEPHVAWNTQEELTKELFGQMISPSQMVSVALQNEDFINRFDIAWKRMRGLGKEPEDLGWYREAKAALARGGLATVVAPVPGQAGGILRQIGKGIPRLSSLYKRGLMQGLVPADEVPEIERMGESERVQELGKRLQTIATEIYNEADMPSLRQRKTGWRGYIWNTMFETTPLMAAAAGAAALTGPVGAYAVGYLGEGEAAYQQTMEDLKDRTDLTDDEKELIAQTDRVIVGSINGLIEQMQADEVLKLGKEITPAVLKEFKTAIRDRAWRKLLALGGTVELKHVASAASEATEEILQEATGIGAEAAHGKSITLKQALAREAQAGLGGLTAGYGLGGGAMGLQTAVGATSLSAEQRAQQQRQIQVDLARRLRDATSGLSDRERMTALRFAAAKGNLNEDLVGAVERMADEAEKEQQEAAEQAAQAPAPAPETPPAGQTPAEAPVAPERLEFVERDVDTRNPQYERDADMQDIMGNAGIFRDNKIIAYHVTSNPEVVVKALESGEPIRVGRGGYDVGDIGGGLYASGAPQLWMGRAPEKWSFRDRLTPENKRAIAEKLAARLEDQVNDGYISRSEYDTALRYLTDLTSNDPTASAVGLNEVMYLSDQPYNIKWWEAEWLEPLGIEPGKKPQEIPMELEGKFARLTRHITADEVEQLRAAGYDGAFIKGGMVSYPQIVVWNNEAVVRFGDYTKPEAPVAPETPAPAGTISINEGIEGQTVYHGTSAPIEQIGTPGEDIYTASNIYGQGFYTTDSPDVATQYTRKGKGTQPTRYAVNVPADVEARLYDLEQPVPEDLKAEIRADLGDNYDLEVDDNEQIVIDTLGGLYDQVRDLSSDRLLSADDAQDIFDGIRSVLERHGYRGLKHQGGKFVGKQPHQVRIFWHPKEDLTIQAPSPATVQPEATIVPQNGGYQAYVQSDQGVKVPVGMLSVTVEDARAEADKFLAKTPEERAAYQQQKTPNTDYTFLGTEVPATVQPEAAASPQWGVRNTGVTRDEYEAIVAKRKRLEGGRQAGGTILFNPEEWADLVKVGRFHVEAGARAFADWSARIVNDLGESIRPHLDRLWKDVNTALETEEGEPEAQRAEEQLSAEAAQEVTPRLYIGNVTPRMKQAWADIFGTSIEDVKPFTEKGFPTKRTPIPMTREQAETYLDFLERDLADRVENNKIATNPDIAKAHADWGDIVALRTVLGIPIGQEPFRVVYSGKPKSAFRDQGELTSLRQEIAALDRENKLILSKLRALASVEDEVGLDEKQMATREALETQYRENRDTLDARHVVLDRMERAAGRAVKVIRTTKEAIAASVTPSILQQSNMTVQDVLRATLKRSARYAKMAYATGRRELRADLRAKREARKRLNKALSQIRQNIPENVDLQFAKAIRELRDPIDLRRRNKAALAEGRTMRRIAEKYPDALQGFPEEKYARLFKKPINDMTIGQLEDLAYQINNLISLGQVKKAQRDAQYQTRKKRDLETLQQNSSPLEKKREKRATLAEGALGFSDRSANTMRRQLNSGLQKRLAITPMDVLFDMMDGTKDYKGPNFTIFKKTIDQDWSRYLNRKDAIQKDVVELANELGMDEANFNRIGVHAAVQQEGGREKLRGMGNTDEEIDAVVLIEDELRLYNLMRGKLDELAPLIEDVMYEVYNQPLERVKNYFSFMTDFEAMEESEIREFFGSELQEFGRRKNVKRKFTITRTGGPQIIKLNAMDIFLKHTDNATYLIDLGADIKRLGEMASTEEYKKAVGDVGQEEVRNWIDLLARKGNLPGKTIPILDVARKHVGAAVIGFKLSSALVNITPLIDGAGFIGGYAFTGALSLADQRWRQFVVDHMPEIRDRFGGDIDLLSFGGDTTIQKLERTGFWLLQRIDGVAAASIAIGAYQKNMSDRGLKVNLSKPDADALAYAQRIVRRSQSSAFFKDVPPAFSGAGRGITGNRSVDRLLLQFQSFMLNRWSVIRHDLIRAGIGGGHLGTAFNLFTWLSLATFAEIGLRRASKELVAMITGDDTDDWDDSITEDIVINILQNVPVVSQLTSVYAYNSVPVPAISMTADIVKQVEAWKRTKDPDKKRLRMLELMILAGGTAAGIPGTKQAQQAVASKRRATSSRGQVKPKQETFTD